MRMNATGVAEEEDGCGPPDPPCFLFGREDPLRGHLNPSYGIFTSPRWIFLESPPRSPSFKLGISLEIFQSRLGILPIKIFRIPPAPLFSV